MNKMILIGILLAITAIEAHAKLYEDYDEFQGVKSQETGSSWGKGSNTLKGGGSAFMAMLGSSGTHLSMVPEKISFDKGEAYFNLKIILVIKLF